MDRQKLEQKIEQTRARLLALFRQAGCDFIDARVVRTSRKLDRLLNLLHRRDEEG